MMNVRNILNRFATLFACTLSLVSCSEPTSENEGTQTEPDKLVGDVQIAIAPRLDVVEGAEDFSSIIYTSEKMIFYAWLTQDKKMVATAEEFRFNGVNWISDDAPIYADNTLEHTLFGYVTGSDADVADYKAIKYNQGNGDLLYTIKNTKPQREQVAMDIKHAMAQLSVEFVFAEFRRDETISFTIPALNNSATLDLTSETPAYTLSNPLDYHKSIEVKVDAASAKVTDIVIPQEISALNVNAYDTEVTLTPQAPIKLEAGKRTLITINVTKNPLVEITMGTVSIEPWDNSGEDVTFDDAIQVGE